MLDVTAVSIDLFRYLLADQLVSHFGPRRCPPQLWKKNSNGEQAHSFADAVIVSLRERVVEKPGNSLTVYFDYANELEYPLRSRLRSVQEGVQTKTPGDDAERCLLSADPVSSCIWRVLLSPILNNPPKCFRIALILTCGISSRQQVHNGKTARLPSKFNIGGGIQAYAVPCNLSPV